MMSLPPLPSTLGDFLHWIHTVQPQTQDCHSWSWFTLLRLREMKKWDQIDHPDKPSWFHIVVYCHLRNKKGEAVLEVGGLSFWMLSGGDLDGGRGWGIKCVARSTIWEGMVIEKWCQGIVARFSYAEISTPKSTGQLQEWDKGEAVLVISGRTSNRGSSQGNLERWKAR